MTGAIARLGFHARTPAGFDVALGWGGGKADDATSRVGRHDGSSERGHRLAATRPSEAA